MVDPSKPKERCQRQPCKNFALDAGLCRMHDPRFDADRRAAGKVRHPRFAKVLSTAPPVDRARVPTIAGVIDRAFDIADAVERGSLDPSQANAMVAALKLAQAGLEAERSRLRDPGGAGAEPQTAPAWFAVPASPEPPKSVQ